MTDNMIELAKRAVACPKWRWMRGMNTTTGDTFIAFSDCDEAYWQGESSSRTSDAFAGVVPDLTDPATLGCLLALYEETRKMLTCPDPVYTYASAYGLLHPRTAEALVAALEAAP
jgi:hypothetical protein